MINTECQLGSVRRGGAPLLLLVLLCVLLSGCMSANGNIIGVGADVAFENENAHRIFIATTRARSDDPEEFYSGERSRGLALGYVDVNIPPNHQIGQIEKPSSGDADPAKHFVVSSPEIAESDQSFRNSINAALAGKTGQDKSVLVFVHGYNVNFSSAVLRIAQFVNDTGYQGVPVLFSWASRGRTLDYVYDLNSALQARNQLEKLGLILSRTNAQHFDVVAHSMGNLVTIEAMRDLRNRSGGRQDRRLRRVILASPDIDIDVFRTQLQGFEGTENLFFVLISDDDKALRLSRRIAGGVSRVGAADPQTLAELGVNVIDLSQIEDKGSANHSKFADSPEIVQLIGKGINQGNTLSAREEKGALQTIAGGVLKSVTIIPTTLLTGTESVIVTLGSGVD
ncbi:MAG: alpha/beta fold hydrolase [Stappiaceae bacterium]